MFRIRRPPSSQNLPIGWANCQKSQCIIYQSCAVIKVLRLVFGQVYLLAYVACYSRFIKSDVCENCEKSWIYPSRPTFNYSFVKSAR